MQVQADTTFTTQIVVAQPLSYFGARIEVPVTRAIVSYWREATLVGGAWTIEDLETPVDPGEYQLVWRTGDPEPPAFEVFIPLFVSVSAVPASGADYPTLADNIEQFRPSPEDIAILENTRTASGGGGELAEFTETTRPNVDQVELLIDQAMGAVLAQLPVAAPTFYYDRIKHAVSLYTATLIEGSFFREELGAGSVDLWRNLYNSSIASLTTAIDAELRQGAGALLLT